MSIYTNTFSGYLSRDPQDWTRNILNSGSRTYTVSFASYNDAFSNKLDDIHPEREEDFDKIINILRACFLFLQNDDNLETHELDPKIPAWLKKYSYSLLEQVKNDIKFVNFNDFGHMKTCKKNFGVLTAKKMQEIWDLSSVEKRKTIIQIKFEKEIAKLIYTFSIDKLKYTYNNVPYNWEQFFLFEKILQGYSTHLKSQLKEYDPLKIYMPLSTLEGHFKETDLSMSLLLNNRTSDGQQLFTDTDYLKILYELILTQISVQEENFFHHYRPSFKT